MTKKALPTNIALSYGALIIANLIWAAAGPIIKSTLDYLPPFTFLFFRFLIVCLLLLPYTVIELSKVKVFFEDWGKIIILGLFSQSSIIFIFWGLKYTTAVDAAIIGAIGVLLSMAAGHYFFYEKVTKGIKVGLILALLGTFIVILEPIFMDAAISNQISTGQRIFGNLLIFVNNVTFLFYIIWSKISFGKTTRIVKKTLNFIHLKQMKGDYHAGLLSALTFFVGLISMVPLAVLENLDFFGPVHYDITQLSWRAGLGIAYMAVFSSIVAYSLFEWALKDVSVSDTAILGYVSSIFGIPFAFWILGEVPSTVSLIGAVTITIGVAIAEVAAHYHRKKRWWEFFKR